MHFAHLTARILAPVNLSLATQSTGNGKPGASSEDGKAATDLPRVAAHHSFFSSHRNPKSNTRSKYAPVDAPASDASFAVANFLGQLPRDDHAGVPFIGQTSRGRQKSREEFYVAFCQSENFTAWLENVAGWVGKKAEAGVLG
jgi:hypothetical protein